MYYGVTSAMNSSILEGRSLPVAKSRDIGLTLDVFTFTLRQQLDVSSHGLGIILILFTNLLILGGSVVIQRLDCIKPILIFPTCHVGVVCRSGNPTMFLFLLTEFLESVNGCLPHYVDGLTGCNLCWHWVIYRLK